MRIVSYNINDSQPWKIEHLLGMDADVLVVPEITCPEDARLPAHLDMQWNGISYSCRQKKWKGLGIIWKKGAGLVPEWYLDELQYAIPLIVGDYLIIGFWPTKPTDNKGGKTYPQIAQEIIHEYAPHFKDYKTLIIGDFNCYVNQYDRTKQYGDMLRVNEVLESYGLFSLYHRQTGEQLGHETTPTFYFRFHEEETFFIDYAYSNFPVSSFRMLPWDKKMSDHLGLEVVV